MPLDPQVAQWLADVQAAAFAPLDALSPADARRQMNAGVPALGPAEEVAAVHDVRAGDLPIRIYRPETSAPPPVVVYYHGGGWVIGDIETHDGYCRALANAAGVVVASVDYRLAPEHPFPAAADDAHQAAQWVADNTSMIGARSGPIAVAGDSAGGNLAAVAALMARDRGGPEIGLQALIYPITDSDLQRPSYEQFASEFYLTRDAMRWFWDQYCPEPDQRHHPYASPLRAELAGLPPAWIATAECDPLRDEGEAYHERLQAAGVRSTLRRYDGTIHGFTRRLNQLDVARQALRDLSAALQATW